MVTLTDVRNDLRIRKEAQSIARDHDVTIVSNIESLPPGPLEDRGLSIINVRMRSRKLPKAPVFWAVKYIEFLLRAVAAARRTRADVYHGHDITGSLPALLAARLTRSKFIYDAHELEADRAGFVEKTWWLRRMQLFCLRNVLRRADLVICANELRAEIMLKEYGVSVLPTPILNVTPRDGLPGGADVTGAVKAYDFTGKRVVLYQGTLARGRGLEYVVAALPHVDDNVVLMIVGHGSTTEIVEQAERDGTRNRIILVGGVPADALVSYMERADVGVAIYQNTCRNNYYCAPNKIYEYASAGLPVAGSDFPGVRQIVLGRGIGRVFDPKLPESIAKAIREILADPDEYQRMSSEAIRIKEEINWEAQEDRLRDAYWQVLSRGTI